LTGGNIDRTIAAAYLDENLFLDKAIGWFRTQVLDVAASVTNS
jgi:hypothetical protein